MTGGLYWLNDQAKAVLRGQLARTARFCGVDVLSYVLLDTHFHLLITVPPQDSRLDLSDDEIVDRVRGLYGDDEADELREGLESKDTAERVVWEAERERYRKLMAELPNFMKLLKQRFVHWYNRENKRKGTIWTGRYKSFPIPGDQASLGRVAAYIDLNATRAGICDDPLNYPFCSYSEAVAVPGMARAGLAQFLAAEGRETSWEEMHAAYRYLLFTTVSVAAGAQEIGDTALLGGVGNKCGISSARVGQVMDQQGKMSAEEVSEHRRRFLTDRAALEALERLERVSQPNKGRPPRPKQTSAHLSSTCGR